MSIQNLEKLLKELFEGQSLIQATFSNPRKKRSDFPYKVFIRPLKIKGQDAFQISDYYTEKVIHTNMSPKECETMIIDRFINEFKQGLLCTEEADHQVLVNKKQQVTILKRPPTQSKVNTEHNRQKQYLLEEGTPIPFLIELGVMNKEGKVYPHKQNKFRQLNRFIEMVDDLLPYLKPDLPPMNGSDSNSFPLEARKNEGAILENIAPSFSKLKVRASREKIPSNMTAFIGGKSGLEINKTINIIDFGCGKSYLTFALDYYLREIKKLSIAITGFDLKADVVKFCQMTVKKLGLSSIHFEIGDISQLEPKEKVHMVITLHACDTATDAALEKAVRWNADVILSVPCCQHELFKQIDSPPLAPILKQGILKERFSAIATDAARVQILTILGYSTQIIEFIETEHTPKNLLIRAVRTGKQNVKKAKEEYLAFKNALHIFPSLEQRFQKELNEF